MGCPVYCIYDYGLGNCCFMGALLVDLFCHAFQVCRPVYPVFYAKIHGLVHYLHIKDPCKFFNVLKLIPYVPGLIMAYLKEIFLSLIRISELAG